MSDEDEEQLEDGPHLQLRNRRISMNETDRDRRFQLVEGWSAKPKTVLAPTTVQTVATAPPSYREPKPTVDEELLDDAHDNSYNSANTEAENPELSQHFEDNFKLLTMASTSQPLINRSSKKEEDEENSTALKGELTRVFGTGKLKMQDAESKPLKV